MLRTVMDDATSAKSKPFDGTNFRRWQNQMQFWLTTLGLISAISDPTELTSNQGHTEIPPAVTRRRGRRSAPVVSPTTEATPSTTPILSSNTINYHRQNRILSALSEKLYDIYCHITSARELWKTLEAKYGQSDPGQKRFKASDFIKYKMVENESIIDQLNEFELMVEQLRSSDVNLDENYVVASLMDKLPPSWSAHVHNLNHIQGELTLNYVLNSIRIEEKNRTKHKKEEKQPVINNLEENTKLRKNQNRNNFNKRRRFNKRRFNYNNNNNIWNNNTYNNNNNNNNNNKRTRAEGNSGGRCCFVCGRTNHFAKDCFYKKTSSPA
uniref:CCHC-type domain-containing protein n=1 Tax=Ananas comosus var. bracteatus TaxID=296719 RepID=A0A6V7PVC3_ANACO|nr:unnamed protein product [Ananas comosus var. bracteatus]